MSTIVNSESIIPSLVHIIKTTSDEKTLALFNSIANSGGDMFTSLRKLNLTTKSNIILGFLA
jgi:hypothetical protein